jgi:hypothetical protein
MDSAKTSVGETLPRFFACVRYGEGWKVFDEKLRDKFDRARPLHDDPLSEEDARELAKAMNDDG